MLGADAGAGGTYLTGGTLELWVSALAVPTFAGSPSVTDLSVLGQTGGGVQGAVTGAAGVVGVTDTLPADAASVS